MSTITEAANPPASRPLSVAAILVMTMLCFSWGFNQVAVKLALPEIPPMIQAAVRSFGALFVKGPGKTRSEGTATIGCSAPPLPKYLFSPKGLLVQCRLPGHPIRGSPLCQHD